MKRSAVRFHAAAHAEAAEGHRYYWERSPAAADGFLLEVERALDEIAEAPRLWPEYVAGTRRFVLRRFPFFIVYLARPRSLTVIAVAHGKRRPGYWLPRLH